MHNAHPQFPVYCQHLIHLSFHHQCVRMYCQRLIHAHRKNHRRQISIVQINDFQWRGWSLGWSYYYNSQCIALQWQTMVAGLVITITMAHDGGWSCEPVVVALHTNAQRHYWQLFWTFLELFATKWIPLSKTVLGNSFWSALTFSDILSLTFVALPGNACTYSGIVQILHLCLFKLHYNSILGFGFASSF